MSDDGGADNPGFVSNDEETTSCGNSSSTASAGEREHNQTPNADSKPDSPVTVKDNNGRGTFGEDKTAKQNGNHHNGPNNNDVGFLNSSVTSVANGNNDVGDKKEPIEAVNLELVSMKPYAGKHSVQIKNQEACEVPVDPYEEYFVPVNEHKKCIRNPVTEVETTVAGVRFDLGPGVGREGLSLRDPTAGLVDYSHWLNALRGEKLYVTKDKRSTGSYWRRALCYGFTFFVVAIIAIVIILTKTGIILTQEPTQPLVDGDKSSDRQFNDVKTSGSQEYVKNPPASPPPLTSTFPPWQTTDETIYKVVPRALEGMLKLDDLEWHDDMSNPKSRVYRHVAEDIESSLVDILRFNDNIPIVKVYSISKDGEVKFRIGQPIFEKPEDNQNQLEDKFRHNGNLIGKYHVNRLKVQSLIDECYSGNLGCSYNCTYDYTETRFTCVCPAGKSLHEDGKQCVNYDDLRNIDFQGTVSDNVQGRSKTPDDIFDSDDDSWKTFFDPHQDEEVSHSIDEFKNLPKLESTSDSTVEPKKEADSDQQNKTKLEKKLNLRNELKTDSKSTTQSNSESKSEPEPSFAPKSEPSAEPNSEPEPSAEPKSEPEPSAEPNSEPHPSSDPSAEPKSKTDTSLKAKSELEPSAEPKKEPSAEPNSEPEPSAEPNSEPEPSAEPNSEPEPSSEPKSEPNPSAEPTIEPNPSAESKIMTDTILKKKNKPEFSTELKKEPSAEPNSEPEPSAEPNNEPEPSAEPKSEPESSAEPKSEPEPSAEPNSEPKPSIESKNEPNPSAKLNGESEPSAESKIKTDVFSGANNNSEPSVEPKSEPRSLTELKLNVESKSKLELSPEPSNEPTVSAKPTSEPELSVKPKSNAETTLEKKKEMETSVEPKSEPSAEPNSEPSAEPNSEPSAEPSSEPELSTEPKSEPRPSTELNSEPHPSAEPEPSAELHSETGSSSKTKSELDKSSTKSKSEARSLGESKLAVESKSDHQPFIEPDSKPHSSAEPNSEPEPVSEPNSEPEPATGLNSESNPSAEPNSNPEPVSEPKSEAETTLEPRSEPETSTELLIEPETTANQKKEPEKVEDSTLKIDYNSESSTENINEDKFKTKSLVHMISKNNSESSQIVESNDRFLNTKESNADKDKVEIFNSKESSTEIHIKPDMKNDKSIQFNDFDFSTISSKEPATVMGPINQKDIHMYEKESSTEMNKEKQAQPKITTEPYFSVVSKNDSESNIIYIKKAPRLDKDEQENPNPFELNIKDVVTSSKSDKTDEPNSNIIKITRVNKTNDDATEDQYNDINDEVPKEFEKNDIDTARVIKKEEKKAHKIYKDKNVDFVIMKNDVKHNKTSINELTTAPLTEKSFTKHSEDPSMTSQIPILPIEIQMDLSTTEANERSDVQTTSQEPEKETISTTILPKTTEQVPILPEEMVTTDVNKQEHTESTVAYQIKKKVYNSSTNTDNAGKDTLETDSSEKSKETINLSNSSDMEIEMTTTDNFVDEISAKTTSNYDMLNDTIESLTENSIKPVSESVDDVIPQTVGYHFLFSTSSEKSASSTEFEDLSEEQLRVISLEEKDKIQNSIKLDNQQVKLKKEKELNSKSSEDSVDNISTTRAVTKGSRNIDDDNIPKLISGTPESDVLKNTNKSHQLNINHEVDTQNENSTAKNFIPVFEDIDENNYFTNIPNVMSSDYENSATTNLPKTESDAKHSTVSEVADISETITLSSAASSSTENIEKLDQENITSFTNNSSTEISVVTTPKEEFPVAFFSKCKSGQFQCVNGTSRDGAYCVSLSAKCDSENDCSDGSDEINCREEGCPGNFQCASGQCLKRHLVCNGIVDCDDGSDEKDCKNWTCQFDEFKCPNERCIPILWQCDGRPDCENHTDEYSCSESCGNDEYLCPIEKWCIPQTWRCNGVPECLNGEDEKLCECGPDQFKCDTGGCIPAEQLCDGVENCPDRSDEWQCIGSFGKNTMNSFDAEKENRDGEFSTRSSPIQIRLSSGDLKSICSDNWWQEFSHQYCRALGYAASETTQYVNYDETETNLLRLIKNPKLNASLVVNLEKTDSCNSRKIVEVTCQEFTCGSHDNDGPTARLAGGTPVSEGQWSSVALFKESKHGAACTASVLSPMFALASYSCIHSHRQSNGWQLFVGGNLLKPYRVRNIMPYPQVKYNQFLYNNDIALVELAEPLVFSRNVSAVCLPNQSLQQRQLCVTAGWGFPVNGEVDLQQYLKFLPVPTYDSEECNATSHYAGFITENNICAGFTDTDKGPCYNDEGAPLMCISETGRWEIHGLLSHHSRCSRGHPAIYSSLTPALSWLRNSVPALQINA